MTTEALLIILAALTAVGVTLVIAPFAPTRPRLADLMQEREATAVVGGPAHRLLESVTRHAKLVDDLDDLALVRRTPEAFVLQRLGFLLAGALWIPLLTVLLALAGVTPPIFLPAAASLACAVVGWQLPVLLLKNKAKHARAAFAGALAAYCRLVALGRLGDRGPIEALRYPVTLGDGWVFHRIKLAIDEAVLRGRMPWDGFTQLADQTGVRALKDVGQIVASAGQDGTSIVETLRAKATSLAQQQLAERKAGSSVRSDRMDMPVALLGLAFITFLAFPGIYLMLTM
ncbi:type II secretion system protein [Amycolatopsis sp. cmx-4-83]|uniref:type II secretion system protein n=1 Tax=Amycolatopsis sp. cmx-4-83 TaxID=2790940 RepID=UPI003979394A